MWVRRLFYRWLMPAAFVLPLWLLVGWGIFHAGGWALLWVLLIAIPSVFLGQLVLALLVRARPSARDLRAVSWLDVAGFTLWHALIVAVGCYPQAWFPLALTGAVLTALVLFWVVLAQLWSEARSSAGGIRFTARVRGVAEGGTPGPVEDEVFVIREVPPAER